ncbi:MAG: hypothetical protein HQL91_03845 [Magnetococcales bacterium]|nr:hypothetical protein [Magnetococcales bacterium]
MVGAVQDLQGWFARHPAGPPVKQLFLDLLWAGLTRLKVDPLPEIPDELKEDMVMLAARMEQWAIEYERKGRLEGRLEGKLEGRLEGRLEGKLEGRLEGVIEVLLDLIEARFGVVPDWVQARLAGADLNTLKLWSKRLVVANRLEQVFQNDA